MSFTTPLNESAFATGSRTATTVRIRSITVGLVAIRSEPIGKARAIWGIERESDRNRGADQCDDCADHNESELRQMCRSEILVAEVERAFEDDNRNREG